jgi:hypothetical protein
VNLFIAYTVKSSKFLLALASIFVLGFEPRQATATKENLRTKKIQTKLTVLAYIKIITALYLKTYFELFCMHSVNLNCKV